MPDTFVNKLAYARLTCILRSGGFDRYELVNVSIDPACIIAVQGQAVKGAVIASLKPREVTSSYIFAVRRILAVGWPLLSSAI